MDETEGPGIEAEAGVRGIHVRRFVFLAMAATLAIAASAIDPEEPRASASTETTLPVPGDTTANPILAPEILDMAEQLGISVDEAVAAFQYQETLAAYIDTVYADPMFVAYRGPFSDGPLLVVEPGATALLLFQNVPPGLEVREAALPATERNIILRDLDSVARAIAGESFLGVTYDAVESEYTIWIDSSANSSEAVIASAASELMRRANATL